MKLKAVVATTCPTFLRKAIESMRADVMERVVGPHLKRPDFGPAEFYIQVCDEAISKEQFCEVRLSGVSITDDRSVQDFRNAQAALQALYKEKIEANLSKRYRCQLMVSIMLDAPPKPGMTTLVEAKPGEPTAIWVFGKA